MRPIRVITTVVATATLSLGLVSCSEEDLATLFDNDSSPATGDIPATNQNTDYYSVTGTAQRDFSTVPGSVEYCEPDELDRAVCAYGELTADTRQAAQDRGRQDITVDPVGWGHNTEVTIPALDGVEGSVDYHGWMLNRSHLLADSLGGTPTADNLVTGTRTQNVGSVNNSGGMAYTEIIARDYLDGNTGVDANQCPLYYAASPNYTGDELLPRTVTVDIQSCDQSIDERVEVDNTANGYALNYADGSYVDTSNH